MKDWKQTSTGKAFAIHLIISLIVFSSLVLTMALFWFPGELFIIDGGWQGLKIVALIDLVLGPALTLLLFKPGKKSLVLDMSVVAAIQIAALSYGFFTTYQQRTLAIVFTSDGFNTLSAAAHKAANETLILKKKTPKLVSDFNAGTPALLGTPLPTPESFGKYLADILSDYPEPHERSDKFLPITDSLEDISNSALSSAMIAEQPESDAIQAALSKRNVGTKAIQVVKFKARYASGWALFDSEQMKILDYIPQPVSAHSTAAGEGENTKDNAASDQHLPADSTPSKTPPTITSEHIE